MYQNKLLHPYIPLPWVCRNFSGPFSKLLPHDNEYKFIFLELGTLLAAAPQKGSPYLSMKVSKNFQV